MEAKYTEKQIEIVFPCEVGQYVIMEDGMSYDEILKANYYRRQGALWLLNYLSNNND